MRVPATIALIVCLASASLTRAGEFTPTPGKLPVEPFTLTERSGRPIGLTATISNGGNRPNSTGTSAKLSDPTIARWFDTAQFTQPAAFTYGNVSRVLPDVNSDGLFNLDFSVFKNFSLTERIKLQFRTEFFNLTNSPTFDTPGRALGAATFGRVTATTATTTLTAKPREIQFALKLSF